MITIVSEHPYVTPGMLYAKRMSEESLVLIDPIEGTGHSFSPHSIHFLSPLLSKTRSPSAIRDPFRTKLVEIVEESHREPRGISRT